MQDQNDVHGDNRMLTFIYGKNIRQKPFNLDACGFFNVGRPTVPAEFLEFSQSCPYSMSSPVEGVIITTTVPDTTTVAGDVVTTARSPLETRINNAKTTFLIAKFKRCKLCYL
ncbi:unnamed protein product [Orchesella dallaii]|uniref:ZP domain-containing protein n=1 Tax=Orchesella dallaii TaxID=48710 RepID=A0ABP1R2S0_9HEXA